MRITFVYADLLLHRHDWTGYFYVGIGSLAAILKEQGHEVSLIHVTKPIDKSEFISKIKENNPDLIGFSSTSPMFPFVRKYVSWLAESEIKAPVICGGIHPTVAPEETIKVDGIDMICRGEGEDAMSELCRELESGGDISNIRNLWVKNNGSVTKNPLRPIIDDLDKLPLPDRSIFDYENLYTEREGKLCFLVSRGCPYNCTYCCNQLIRSIYGSEGKKIRFRSVDSVITEIKQLLEQYPAFNMLNFDDDILFLRKDWSEEFAEKYSKEINLPFICNARANLTNKALVDLLKKAGCCHVKFGLESGNEYLSNKILNRNLTNDQIKKAFALCRDAGLITESFNMVGIPYDTPSTILDTIKLNAVIKVDRMQVSIYQPYIGTKLAELCKTQVSSMPEELKPDWFTPTLELNTVSISQVLMFRDYFKVLVRYYQLLLKLEGKPLKVAIKVSDGLLSSLIVSKLLNAVYLPLNYIFRKMQVLKTKC